ncbi:hypothetical protein CBER1_02662 [Cercospora berteroae]|uniref:N(6)-L-threonylcarbamoyladenine synthase n=1 Tax=Cercospora berteroae TaxID=357750 RepID=A0A2S6CJU0_9PEZI|nr:hypothetical protein CBER1_02662 [Cercospora berteroae]
MLRVAYRRLGACAAHRRRLTTLAIETSCDDTSVGVLEQTPRALTVHFHEKITANNDAYNGIHPLVALHSHRAHLALLMQKALSASPRPDFIAATRGPGMRSNLAVGLDTGKGLALGLGIPFLGVHHMQAHALTPRLVHAMDAPLIAPEPEFPFLTVLVSGGHTMLIDSRSLTEHSILAETGDIALGDCLDKAARAILPAELLQAPYGRALEEFAFPNGPESYNYEAPARRQEELECRPTQWHWALRPPFAESKGGIKTSRRMAFSFAGLLTSVQRFLARKVSPDGTLTTERVAFEHVASRLLLHLSSSDAKPVNTVVISGGVASNIFMRTVMRKMLDVRGHAHIKLEFPPVPLCTDNALMIAWTALEMWHAGYRSGLDVQPIRKWSMDPASSDGGILGVEGWHRVESPG